MRAGALSQVMREFDINANSRPSKRAIGKEATQKMTVFFAPSRKSSNTTEYWGMKCPFSLGTGWGRVLATARFGNRISLATGQWQAHAPTRFLMRNRSYNKTYTMPI